MQAQVGNPEGDDKPNKKVRIPRGGKRHVEVNVNNLGFSTMTLVFGFVKGRRLCASESSRLARTSRTLVGYLVSFTTILSDVLPTYRYSLKPLKVLATVE